MYEKNYSHQAIVIEKIADTKLDFYVELLRVEWRGDETRSDGIATRFDVMLSTWNRTNSDPIAPVRALLTTIYFTPDDRLQLYSINPKDAETFAKFAQLLIQHEAQIVAQLKKYEEIVENEMLERLQASRFLIVEVAGEIVFEKWLSLVDLLKATSAFVNFSRDELYESDVLTSAIGDELVILSRDDRVAHEIARVLAAGDAALTLRKMGAHNELAAAREAEALRSAAIEQSDARAAQAVALEDARDAEHAEDTTIDANDVAASIEQAALLACRRFDRRGKVRSAEALDSFVNDAIVAEFGRSLFNAFAASVLDVIDEYKRQR